MPPMPVIVPGERGVVAAASATPPMLLDPRRWGVDQVLWLPGVGGNYASIPDVNLLNADKAHPKATLADGWVVNDDATAHAFVGGAGIAGHGVLMRVAGTPDTAAGLLQSWSGSREPITAGQTYSIRGLASANIATSPISIELGMYFYDADVGGTLIQNFWSSPISLTSDPVEVTRTATAPTGATHVSFFWRMRYQNGTTLTVGDEVVLTNFCFRTGSDPTFVPSHRIVGDIDVRAKIAKTIWGVDDEQYFMATYDGSQSHGYIFSHGIATSDKLRIVWWEGAAAHDVRSTVPVPVGNQEPLWVRATVDMDNGASQRVVTFYYSNDGANWTQLEQIVFAGTSYIQAHSKILGIGGSSSGSRNVKGALFKTEARDGINGPIVASADFTNPAEVTGDNWTTPEGHAASISRSGDATSELVDRACWAFAGGTSEWLEVPENPLIDIGSADFSVFGSSNSRTTGVDGLVATRHGGGVPGWSVESWGAAMRLSMADDSQHFALYNNATLSNGTWHMGGIGRSDGLVRAFVDGTEETDTDSIGGLSSPYDLRYGRSVNGAWNGLSRWLAGFTRVLTNAERAELAAWDGSVANEPSWLRSDPALVLYLNADDLESTRKYASDGVAYMPLSRSRQIKKITVPAHVAA